MAADISESGGHECKGDSRSNTKLDADYPLRVLYCGGKCGGAERTVVLAGVCVPLWSSVHVWSW